MRLIALMNQKGGVGKTTTTVNLAAAIARSGSRVLLVDLDPQAHATLHLGIDPAALDSSVYDLLLDPGADPAAALRAERENLWVLPAETDLAAADQELADAPDRQQRLGAAVARLGDRFDVVLFDCPPSLGVLTLGALAAADEVLIPMQAHFLALQGVSKLLETVRLVGTAVNPRLRVLGVVLCMHEQHTTLAQEVVQDLESYFEQAAGTGVPWDGARILRPPIRRNIKLAECPSFGQTIFEYAPDAAGAQDYAQLARDVTGADPRENRDQGYEQDAPIVITRPAVAPQPPAPVQPDQPGPEPSVSPVVPSPRDEPMA
ncbi:MAG: AAA family ATPase [Planctomycetota bacterium]